MTAILPLTNVQCPVCRQPETINTARIVARHRLPDGRRFCPMSGREYPASEEDLW